MGVIIRQSLKHSVATYIGVVIGAINVLFLYNKYLTPEELGLYTTLTSIPYIFTGLSHLGTPLVAVRFFSLFENSELKHRGFLFYMLIVPLIGFLLFVIIYFLSKNLFFEVYGQHSPLLTRYFWVFPVISFFLLYFSIFETYSRLHLRIVVPVAIREVLLKGGNSLLAIGLGLSYINFHQMVLGIIILYVSCLILIIIYIKSLGRLYLDINLDVFKSPHIKDMLRFSSWTLLGGLTGTILPHLEKIMLPAYANGLEMTAIFAIAMNIGMVIAIPRTAISSIAEPILASSIQKKDFKNVENIYRKSSLNLLMTGLFLFMGVWLNIDEIFSIIPNSDIYSKGKWVVFIVGLYSVSDMATGLNSEILRNSNFFRLDFYLFYGRLILLIATNLLLIPKFGYNGAALSMLVSVILYNYLKFHFIKTKMNIQPFSKQTISVILLAILAFFVTHIIDINSTSLGFTLLVIMLKSLVMTVIFLGGILYFKINPDFGQAFKAIRTKLSFNLFRK